MFWLHSFWQIRAGLSGLPGKGATSRLWAIFCI